MAALLYLHITWTTLDRAPMIGPGVQRFLKRFLPAEAERHGARVLALGMVSDHVHIVLEAPLRLDLPRLLMGFKGASSCEVNKNIQIPAVGLRWAKGYDARTVGPRQLHNVIEYVKSQRARHPDRAIAEDDESLGPGTRPSQETASFTTSATFTSRRAPGSPGESRGGP